MEDSQFTLLEEKIHQTLQYVERLQQENQNLKDQLESFESNQSDLRSQLSQKEENMAIAGARVQSLIDKLDQLNIDTKAEESSHS